MIDIVIIILPLMAVGITMLLLIHNHRFNLFEYLWSKFYYLWHMFWNVRRDAYRNDNKEKVMPNRNKQEFMI